MQQLCSTAVCRVAEQTGANVRMPGAACARHSAAVQGAHGVSNVSARASSGHGGFGVLTPVYAAAMRSLLSLCLLSLALRTHCTGELLAAAVVTLPVACCPPCSYLDMMQELEQQIAGQGFTDIAMVGASKHWFEQGHGTSRRSLSDCVASMARKWQRERAVGLRNSALLRAVPPSGPTPSVPVHKQWEPSLLPVPSTRPQASPAGLPRRPAAAAAPPPASRWETTCRAWVCGCMPMGCVTTQPTFMSFATACWLGWAPRRTWWAPTLLACSGGWVVDSPSTQSGQAQRTAVHMYLLA